MLEPHLTVCGDPITRDIFHEWLCGRPSIIRSANLIELSL